MADIIWIHEDALRADHPVFATAPKGRSVAVIDPAYLREEEYALKRLVFILECYQELPVDIYKGDTVSVLTSLCVEERTDTVHVPATPNPRFKAIIAELRRRFTVHVVPDVPFVTLDDESLDLKRFSRYWRKAERMLMG